MFGLFTPSCPLATGEKAWVERRMAWLSDRFGFERMRQTPVILPTEEFFPDRYDGDDATAHVYFERVCRYMRIDPTTVTLEFVIYDDMPGAAGLYQRQERSNIYVARSQLEKPAHLISTFTHELAHELLLKGELLTVDVVDHELVTDLLPVVLGLGVFTANTTVQSKCWSDGTMSSFSISRQGYLSSITLGYALALFAFARGETKPAWASHLRTDASATLKKGMKFLTKTGDTLFHPETLRTKQEPASNSARAEQLRHPSPTFRINAIWDILDSPEPSPELLTSVEQCTRDRDPDVRSAGIEAIGTFGHRASAMVPVVIERAEVGSPAERIAAVGTLSKIADKPGTVVPTIADALADANPAVVTAAAWALARFGREARDAEEQLLKAVKRSAAVTDMPVTEALVEALHAACPDLPTLLECHSPGPIRKDCGLSHH